MTCYSRRVGFLIWRSSYPVFPSFRDREGTSRSGVPSLSFIQMQGLTSGVVVWLGDGALLRELKRLIRVWRTRLMIDPRWKIKIELEDPETCARNGYTASICVAWKRWDATIKFDRDLGKPELWENGSGLEWSVVHELLELATYETYEIFSSILDNIDQGPIRSSIDQLYKAARDRQIEKLVPAVRKIS